MLFLNAFHGIFRIQAKRRIIVSEISPEIQYAREVIEMKCTPPPSPLPPESNSSRDR